MNQEELEQLRQRFNRWRRNDVTQAVFLKLRDEREKLVTGMVYGHYENNDVVRGIIQAIDNLLNIDMEEVYGSE